MSKNHCDNLRPDAMSCLQKGHRQLQPGVYVCAEGHCHINGPELCVAHGYPATEHNMKMLGDAAMKALGVDAVEIVP